MPAKINNDGIEIGIFVRDAEKSLGFYRDLLGLAPLGELDFPGHHMWRFQAGKSVVKLLTKDPTPTGSNPMGDATGMRYLSLFVSNLDELVGDIEEAGCTILVPVTEFQPGARFAFVRDPEGNQIELLDVTVAG